MCLLGFVLVFSSVCEEWDHIATRAFSIVVASKSHPAADKILKFIVTGLGGIPSGGKPLPLRDRGLKDRGF